MKFKDFYLQVRERFRHNREWREEREVTRAFRMSPNCGGGGQLVENIKGKLSSRIKKPRRNHIGFQSTLCTQNILPDLKNLYVCEHCAGNISKYKNYSNQTCLHFIKPHPIQRGLRKPCWFLLLHAKAYTIVTVMEESGLDVPLSSQLW